MSIEQLALLALIGFAVGRAVRYALMYYLNKREK